MFIITKHAEKRCKQRGIKKEHVLLFLKYAEVENNIGNGDISYTSGKKSKKEMFDDGIPNELVSKFNKLAVVICANNIIKTCLYMTKENGKKYRKSFKNNYSYKNVVNDNNLFSEGMKNGWSYWP